MKMPGTQQEWLWASIILVAGFCAMAYTMADTVAAQFLEHEVSQRDLNPKLDRIDQEVRDIDRKVIIICTHFKLSC